MDDIQRQAILSQFTSDELFAEWTAREAIALEKLLDELPTLEQILRDLDEAARRTEVS